MNILCDKQILSHRILYLEVCVTKYRYRDRSDGLYRQTVYTALELNLQGKKDKPIHLIYRL